MRWWPHQTFGSSCLRACQNPLKPRRPWPQHESNSHARLTLLSPGLPKLLAMTRNDIKRNDGLRLRVVALVLIAMFALPAFAAAQTPAKDQYRGPCLNCSLSGGGAGNTGDPGDPGDPSGLSGNVGPLPFTGFDVIAMLAVALTVTGIGLTLQRAVARESTEEL